MSTPRSGAVQRRRSLVGRTTATKRAPMASWPMRTEPRSRHRPIVLWVSRNAPSRTEHEFSESQVVTETR